MNGQHIFILELCFSFGERGLVNVDNGNAVIFVQKLLCNFEANAASPSCDDHYRLGAFFFFHRFNSMAER